MNELKDLILADGDVLLEGGDFVVGVANEQHRELLLVGEKGEWKEAPMRGVGVAKYIEGYGGDDFAREIQTEFTRDGMRVRKINIDLPKIEIGAEYEN